MMKLDVKLTVFFVFMTIGRPTECALPKCDSCVMSELSDDVESNFKSASNGGCNSSYQYVLEMSSCGTGYKVVGGPSTLFCEDGFWIDSKGDKYELGDYGCEINYVSVAIAAAIMLVIILLFIAIVVFACRNFKKRRRPTRARPNEYTRTLIGGNPYSHNVDMYAHSSHSPPNQVVTPVSETADYTYVGNHIDQEPPGRKGRPSSIEYSDENLGGSHGYASLPYFKQNERDEPQIPNGAATEIVEDNPSTAQDESVSALYATVNKGAKASIGSSSHSENTNEHDEVATDSKNAEMAPPPETSDNNALYAVVQKKNKDLQSKYERPTDLVKAGSVKDRISLFTSADKSSGSNRTPPEVNAKTTSTRNRFLNAESNNLSPTTAAHATSTQLQEEHVPSTQEQTSSQSPPEEDEVPPPPPFSPPPPPVDEPPPSPPVDEPPPPPPAGDPPPPPPPDEPPLPRPEINDNWQMKAQPTSRINRAERPASTGDLLSDKSRKRGARKDPRQGNSFREHNGSAQSGNMRRPNRAKTAYDRHASNSTVDSNASSGRVKFEDGKKGRLKDWIIKDLSVPDKKKKSAKARRSESMKSRNSSVRSQERNENSRAYSVKSRDGSRRQQGPVARAIHTDAYDI